MFHRISYDEWTSVVPIIAFILTFGAFLVLTLRAVAMRRARRDYMARMPLQDDETQSGTQRSIE